VFLKADSKYLADAVNIETGEYRKVNFTLDSDTSRQGLRDMKIYKALGDGSIFAVYQGKQLWRLNFYEAYSTL